MYDNKRYKRTNFKYTQPVYMNGIEAPAILAIIPGYLIMQVIPMFFTTAMTLSLCGIGLAAWAFIVTYRLFIRRCLLNGHLPLKYYSEKYRAVPFGFVIWTLTYLGLTILYDLQDIIDAGYPNIGFYIGVPFCTALVLLYVSFYWLVMVGDIPIKNAGLKAKEFVGTMAARYQYRPAKRDENPVSEKPASKSDFTLDEDGFVKVDFAKQYVSKKKEPRTETKAKKTLEKLSRAAEQEKPIVDEEFVVSSTPKLKKNKHLNGIVDRRKR